MQPLPDFVYYEVQEDGATVEIDSFSHEASKVLIVVDHGARIVSLWKGSSAPIRLKFIGSRASGDTRKEVGFHYKLDVQDQGDEDKSFLQRVLGSADVSTGEAAQEHKDDFDARGGSYSEAAAKQGITISDDEIKRDSGTGGKFANMGGLTQRPQASFLATGFTDTATGEKVSKKQVKKTIQKDDNKEAITILEELGIPKGYSREMVVVGQKVYRVTGKKELKFEKLDTPLDGIIMIKEYTPRILAEGGTIKAIELLKRNSEDIEDDSVLSQDLADLTAMFQIEIS